MYNNTIMKPIESIAEEVADQSVIAFTQVILLTPEEAFRLNHIIFVSVVEILKQNSFPK